MTTTTFLSVLPLRLTIAQQDMAGMLSSWMDNSPSLGLSSFNCGDDLETIDRLRRDIAQSLGESKENAYEEGLKIIGKFHAYYNYLLECEENGMVHGGKSSSSLSSSIFLSLEWKSALTDNLQTSHSLEMERANIIWNLATLEAYQASKEPLNSKPGWNKASKRIQNAASWLEHLLKLLLQQQSQQREQYPDFSTTFIRFWQALLLAEAQQCIYESLLCARRPMHLLVAKLAAAAVPLYNDAETIAKSDSDSATPAMSQCSDLVETWDLYARGWGIYMSCKAEYHQSQIDREKKLWGQELARLDLAYQYAAMCKELCEQTPLAVFGRLRTAVDDTLKLLLDRLGTAERENADQHKQPVPKRQELMEIRGEKLVKIEESISKLLRSKDTEPIFQKRLIPNQQTESSILQEKDAPAVPNLQTYVKVFESEMNDIIVQMANATEEQTESTRVALAAVNLPHSLTAYRQEQSGGGIPDELWQRVHIIQQENRIVQLKQDLWELRDAADLARTTYQKIQSQLDFDIESDQLFRQENPGFEGHDVGDVQKSFRHSLANYDKLLSTAQEGDSVLFRRLEQLDIEPKYNLLQCTKSQLDCLLPGARGDPDPDIAIDTQHLSYLLAELSALFQEREELLNRFRKELERYDIQGALQSRVDPTTGSDQDYLEASKFAQKAFDGMIYEIQKNMERQKELLDTILVENERFMMARERTSTSESANSCIVFIEDAIEEIDQLSKHLKEGKDFYNVVIPKLEKLKQQVGDVSARLTVERLEFDDKTRRASQELKDELMAKNLFSESGGSSQRPSNPNGAQPNQENEASHQANNVDDEKVATLVAMEFDPDKVVAALEKHDNDVDQALNELLSC